MIHDTAIVSDDAELADDVEVGPYAIIEGATKLASGCRIAAHAIVRRGSILDEGVVIDSFAVVGGDPQDFKFDSDMPSGVRLGKEVKLRESATVHRSARENGFTEVGSEVFLMCSAHIGHDCVVGNNAILANNVSLGGEVEIGSHVFLGGGAVVHQFVRIGESVMMSGYSAASRDAPPFVTAANRNTVCGLNMVGLQRRGFTGDEILDLKRCYREIYFSVGNPELLARVALEKNVATTDKGRQFFEFFKSSRIGGYINSRNKARAGDE